MVEDLTLEEIAVSKVMCLRSSLFHTRFFFYYQQKRKFIIGEHHKIICDALDRVFSGECKRLIINIAPRYGKTEIAVKSFISQGLALNPAAKFIHLSYSDDLALDNSEAVKDLVQSVEYQTLFPEVVVKKDSKAKDKWYTTKGGGVLARAAAGQVTGFGAGAVDTEDLDIDEFMQGTSDQKTEDTNLEKRFQFAGAIIIDDPIKPEDADADVKREKVNSRFDSTIRNRVNSRNTPIIIIMQRLHPDDLCGYLMREDEMDKWEVISLPCLKEDGTALWPFKHTVEELKAIERSNEYVFARQYQQNPNSKTGLLFPKQDLNFADFSTIEALNDPDYTYICADPANEGGDDFAGGAFKLVGDKIYVDNIIYNTDGADFNEPLVSDLCLALRAPAIGIEGVLGWKESAERIRAHLTRNNYPGEFRILRPRKSKHSRILNKASFIRNNFVFRSDYQQYPQYAKFIRVLTSYLKIQEAGKSNKTDDAPDLCEMAGSYYEKNFPHLWPLKS